MFGFLPSDEVYVGTNRRTSSQSFNRCDRGGHVRRPSHAPSASSRRNVGAHHLLISTRCRASTISWSGMSACARPGYQPRLGRWQTFARQPDLRLLGRPVAARARALEGRRGRAERAQRLRATPDRDWAQRAVGRAAAAELRRARDPLGAAAAVRRPRDLRDICGSSANGDRSPGGTGVRATFRIIASVV